ncbi:hypothetical protein A9995_15730 [Erythrobacter sp. QSSC1-22B]|nr:hypothetical protein A9995_15730 [Erythrobacter sp. QSSC1-22B]
MFGAAPLGDRRREGLVPTYAEVAQQHIDHAKTDQKRPENTVSLITTYLLPQWGRSRRIHPV